MQSSFQASDTLVSALPQLGVIRVEGPDAVDYLQGKLTIDMYALEDNEAQLGCHCDFKGKTWSVFYALKDQDLIQLVCPLSSIEASLGELKKYGVFSKVDFADASTDWRFFGGQGAAVSAHLTELFGELPSEDGLRVSNEFGTVIRLDHPHTRYLCMLTPPAAAELEDVLAENMVEPQWWEQLDIMAGIATIYASTASEFVPQMMNLQMLDAINFNKGCYMGQEVVARTKYLGKNKRAAFILYSDQISECQPGETLESQVGENWRRSGTVLRHSCYQGHSYILAVLPIDSQPGQLLRLKDQPEVHFTVQPLPYSLES